MFREKESENNSVVLFDSLESSSNCLDESIIHITFAQICFKPSFALKALSSEDGEDSGILQSVRDGRTT